MLNKITRMDALTVLPPGLYSLVVMGMAYELRAAQPPLEVVDVLSAMTTMVDGISGNPGLLVLAIFGIYLIGTVIRVLPVWWVERVTPPFHASFPSTKALKRFKESVEENASSFHHLDRPMPEIGESVPIEVFNHWKNTLCLRSPDGFQHYLTFESRTRFYAGMFWAAMVGIVSTSTLFPRTPVLEVLPLFTPSVLIAVLFGFQFRRVRRQEAQVLYSVYSALDHG